MFSKITKKLFWQSHCVHRYGTALTTTFSVVLAGRESITVVSYEGARTFTEYKEDDYTLMAGMASCLLVMRGDCLPTSLAGSQRRYERYIINGHMTRQHSKHISSPGRTREECFARKTMLANRSVTSSSIYATCVMIS